MMRIAATGLLALLMTTLVPLSAFAHALHLHFKLAGDKVVVEAFYSDDTRAPKAKVQVFNAKDEVIASGDTDDKGKWSFPAPAPGKYVVDVNAGAGHRAKRPFNMPDPADHSKAAETPPTPEKTPAPPTKGDTISPGPTKEEITGTPWLEIAIGLAVIGVCSGAFVVALRLKRGACLASPPEGSP